MATTDPVGPFGATVDGVQALLPMTTLLETRAPGQQGVTVADAVNFLTSVSGRVEGRLYRWERLTADAETAVIAAAKDLVETGAASYVQAARHPEQSDPSRDSYASVLWSRFETGLETLAARVDTFLEDARDVDDTAAGTDGAAWAFPVTAFPDDAGW